MVWFRCRLIPALLVVVPALFSGCQTQQSALSCGEACICVADEDPLIIFIGADRDLGKWGKLPEITRDFCRRGYNAVYLDPWKQLHDVDLLASWIRNAVKCRGRRVMLVGWSQGAVVGLKALQIVAREGICVDTFIELDSFNTNLYMGSSPHPSNANRVVLIHSKLNRPTRGYRLDAVHRLDSCWHLGSPTHPHATRVLFSEARRLQGSGNHYQIPVTSTSTSNLTASAPTEQPPTVARLLLLLRE